MEKQTHQPATMYPELNQVLDALVSRMQRILEGDFVGAYLQGSFAVGDYDQHSDVDFVVAVERELPSRQVEALQGMHGQVYDLDSEWAKHLEGSYFPREILRRHDRRGLELWYLDHGARSLERSDHCNTALVRWVVREKGVRLAGPPPKTLVDPIPTALLRAEMFETLTTWGQQLLDDPSPYNNWFYQGFIVLSYCRMLHDLYRGYPGSKREGAEWAKSALDPSWAGLIDGAWDSRPDPARKVRQPADGEAFEKTLRFVEYIMEKSRAVVSEEEQHEQAAVDRGDHLFVDSRAAGNIECRPVPG
jgi:predicted nucleotidyltransferase